MSALSHPVPVEAPRAGGWPFVGALPHLTALGPIEFFSRAWRRHGDAFRAKLGPRDVLMVIHPDAVEEVLITRRERYVKGASYRHMRLLTGDGLLTLEGDPWRRRRRLAQPAFHKESVRQLTERFVAVTGAALDKLERRLPAGGVVEAHEEMMHLTLEIVGETLFALRFGDERAGASGPAFAEALDLLSKRGHSPVALPLSIPTPGNLKLRRSLQLLDRMVYEIIAEARSRQGDPSRIDLLSMLIASRDADTGEALSDRELRDEVITLVLAGHETTALLLSWAFTLLGRHPEVVERMRAEVTQVLGARPPTPDDLPKLGYLRQVIDEVLRLRPPAWTLARDVAEDGELAGFRVSRGETVMPIIYFTHRHPDFWERPEAFDPDRMRPELQKARHGCAYLPFSLGPRMCIGNLFSLVEAQVILAMLLQRADFELPARDPPMKPLITLRVGGPLPLKLRWRPRA